jgi:hypothetical protein
MDESEQPRLNIERIEQHPGGACLVGEPDPEANQRFLSRASVFLVTKTCRECCGVWITHPDHQHKPDLCPCCNPSHPGYAKERSYVLRKHAQMLPRWRNELLELLELRATGAGPVGMLVFTSGRAPRLML